MPHYLGDVNKENVHPDFINRIGIGEINVFEKPISKFEKPIKLDKLEQMNFKFIKEYLNAPIGHSIIQVPKGDWDKFRKEFRAEFRKLV